MIPCFCIYLEEEPWKKSAAASHFDERDIRVEWISGFHGPTIGLSADLACERFSNGTRSYVHVNQIGATLSYLMALRTGLLITDEDFIIFEDDVILCENFVTVFERLHKRLKSHHVAQLGYCRSEDKLTQVIDADLSRCVYPFGNAAIWWSRKGAELAVRSVKPICEPTDIAFMRRVYPFLSHVIVTPPIAEQRTAKGDWPSSVGMEYKPIC